MLKIAIIGTGNISHNHIQGYLEFADRCQIVALVDIYPEKAEEKKRHYGLTNAKVYASHEESDYLYRPAPMYNAHSLALHASVPDAYGQ